MYQVYKIIIIKIRGSRSMLVFRVRDARNTFKNINEEKQIK